jgi:hypothetical protein
MHIEAAQDTSASAFLSEPFHLDTCRHCSPTKSLKQNDRLWRFGMPARYFIEMEGVPSGGSNWFRSSRHCALAYCDWARRAGEQISQTPVLTDCRVLRLILD